MAAGSGSRYGALKQFDALGPQGSFLMEYSIYDAVQAGFKQVVVITKKENVEELKNYLAPKVSKFIQLDVVAQELTDLPSGITPPVERVKPWGTAHAVWAARNVISNSFVVINADDYYGQEAFKDAANFITNQKSDTEFGLVTYPLGNTLSEYGTVSRGVCEVENGYLENITERLKLKKISDRVLDEDSGLDFSLSTLVSMNFWICTPRVFEEIEKEIRSFFADASFLKSEVYIPTVMSEMKHKEIISIKAIESNSSWFGVTYTEDKAMAVTKLAQFHDEAVYPPHLWE
jgi:NDP-sugar pyrophosphorylase family protein